MLIILNFSPSKKEFPFSCISCIIMNSEGLMDAMNLKGTHQIKSLEFSLNLRGNRDIVESS
jgi:hypothetical protein